MYGDVCPDVAPAASNSKLPRNCGDGFFSAKNLRDVLYSGNDVPRLYTGEAPREGGLIDTSKLNPGPRSTAAPFVGYMGPLRIEYAAEVSVIDADVENIRSAGAKRFDPNQKITVEFNKATIDFVLRQLLGGALGVNYVAPEGLGGSVTFRTETPIPKGQVLHVVRDILARNNLIMRFSNGVYHIGSPELIGALDANSRAGENNELGTRVVRLRKGNANDVIAIARQLLPATVILLPSNVANTIIVRAPAGDIGQVEETLKSLSGEAIGDDRVAVIPLRQSAPERMALQLTEFYRSRISPGGEVPTFVALEKQQALLVGTKDPQAMAAIRQLVQQMDRDNADEATLRVIELKHLAAEEIAEKLGSIFGASTAQSAGGGRTGFGNNGGRPSSGRGSLFPPGQLANPNQQTPLQDTDNPSEAAPGFSVPGLGSGSGGGPGGGSNRGGSGGQQGNVVAAGLGGGGGGPPGAPGSGPQVRIVADPRTNTIMVYSTFSIFKRIRDVLQALDIPQSQVVIEAMVVEVELNDQLDHGVQMFLNSPYVAARTGGDPIPTGQTAPITSPTSASGAFVSVGASFGQYRVDAVMQALQSITNVKVISSPYLTVLDNKTARLVVGDQIPYAVRSQTSQNTGNVTVTQEVEIKDTGIILDVTPRIFSDNSLSLRINQQVSTPSPTAQAGNTTPVISTRNVESNVRAQSGHTILLGGLIQDRLETSESGVPVLRAAPVLGDLFKQRTDHVRRVELLVMLTPRVIRQNSQIEDISRLIKSQMHTRRD